MFGLIRGRLFSRSIGISNQFMVKLALCAFLTNSEFLPAISQAIRTGLLLSTIRLTRTWKGPISMPSCLRAYLVPFNREVRILVYHGRGSNMQRRTSSWKQRFPQLKLLVCQRKTLSAPSTARVLVGNGVFCDVEMQASFSSSHTRDSVRAAAPSSWSA